MTEESELKACPFCAGAGSRMTGITNSNRKPITETDGCASCGIWLTPEEWDNRPLDSGSAEKLIEKIENEFVAIGRDRINWKMYSTVPERTAMFRLKELIREFVGQTGEADGE